jgi:hypothetical protein
MSTPGVAVPGTSVPSSSAISPAGPQGIQGPQGTPGTGGSGAGGTKTWSKWNANEGQPPASAYAVWATRNSVPLLGFNDTTSWATIFIGIVPESAVVSSGILVRIFWLAASATSGAVQWGVAVDAMTAGSNPTSDSFDTAVTNSPGTSAPATNGVIALSTITLTSIDSIGIGDGYRLKLYRDAASGNDTMTGDAQVVAVEVRSAN